MGHKQSGHPDEAIPPCPGSPGDGNLTAKNPSLTRGLSPRHLPLGLQCPQQSGPLGRRKAASSSPQTLRKSVRPETATGTSASTTSLQWTGDGQDHRTPFPAVTLNAVNTDPGGTSKPCGSWTYQKRGALGRGDFLPT